MFKFKMIILVVLFPFSFNTLANKSIWFSPNNDNFLIKKNEYKYWKESIKRINVYKFYYQQVVQDKPSVLCQKISFLLENNIRIAVEWPILKYNENGIGKGVEGFSDNHTTQKIINRFKGCGAKIDYVVMDEPIYWGVIRKGPEYPQLDLLGLANNMKDNISLLKDSYPNIKIGQVEPIQQLGGEYLSIFDYWLSTFYRVTGSKISFVHQDVIWGEGYLSSMMKLSHFLKIQDIDYGIIFNASSPIKDDSSWMSSSRKNVDSLFKSDINYNDAIFQSWNHHPININVESNSNSHISIINYYANHERN